MLGRFLAGVQVRVAGVDQQGNFPVGGRRSSMSPPPGGLCRVGAAQGFRGGVGNGLAIATAIATAIAIASLVEREQSLCSGRSAPRTMQRASYRPLTPILKRPGLDLIDGDVEAGRCVSSMAKVWRRIL